MGVLKIERETIYALLLFFVSFSLSVGYKLSSISIIILTIFFILDKRLFHKLKLLKNNNIVYFFIAYFIINLLGLLYTTDFIKGKAEVTVKLTFFILPIIIFTEEISKQKLFSFFIAFKYWLILFSLFLLYHKLFIIGGPLFTLPTYSLNPITGIHHAYFSLFYILMVGFVIYQIENQKIKFFYGYLELVYLLFFITLLGSRIITGVILLYAIFFLVNRIIVSSRKQKLLLIGSFILTSYFVVKQTNFASKFDRLSKVEWSLENNIYNHQVFTFEYDDVNSNSLELRLIKWYCALQILKENVLIGVGTGDFKTELVKKYTQIDFKKGMAYKYNTHNQFLEEFVKFGLIGGLFFILFMLKIIVDAINSRNKFLFIIITSFSLFLIFESVFERQHGVVFFTLFIPILYKYHQIINRLNN